MRPTVAGPAGVFKDVVGDRPSTVGGVAWRSCSSARRSWRSPCIRSGANHPTGAGRGTGRSTELVVADLPTTLLDESVRVSGRAAAAARVIGVDLHHRDLAEVPDERVRAAEAAVRMRSGRSP